jgi:hypothetical protein
MPNLALIGSSNAYIGSFGESLMATIFAELAAKEYIAMRLSRSFDHDAFGELAQIRFKSAFSTPVYEFCGQNKCLRLQNCGAFGDINNHARAVFATTTSLMNVDETCGSLNKKLAVKFPRENDLQVRSGLLNAGKITAQVETWASPRPMPNIGWWTLEEDSTMWAELEGIFGDMFDNIVGILFSSRYPKLQSDSKIKLWSMFDQKKLSTFLNQRKLRFYHDYSSQQEMEACLSKFSGFSMKPCDRKTVEFCLARPDRIVLAHVATRPEILVETHPVPFNMILHENDAGSIELIEMYK